MKEEISHYYQLHETFPFLCHLKTASPIHQQHDSQEIHLSILHNSGMKTLWVLDIHSLDVRVQLLLGALLIVTLTADTDTDTEGNALDTGFPDLLVQLGVEADVTGALEVVVLVTTTVPQKKKKKWKDITYHSVLSEAADLLDSSGSTFLERNTMDLFPKREKPKLVFRPKCPFCVRFVFLLHCWGHKVWTS